MSLRCLCSAALSPDAGGRSYVTVMLSSAPSWRCTITSRVACRPPGDKASVPPVKPLITGTCSLTHSPVTSSFSGSRGAGLGDDASAGGPDCASMLSSRSSTIRPRSLITRVFASPIVGTPCEVSHAAVGSCLSSLARAIAARTMCGFGRGPRPGFSRCCSERTSSSSLCAGGCTLPSRRAAGTNGKCSRSALREASRKATLRREFSWY